MAESPAPVLAERFTLSQQEAAAALGVSVDHFERHVKPDLPVVIAGRKRLYSVKAIEAWLEEQQLVGGRRAA